MTAGPRPSLRQLARELGVSAMTVSLALRGARGLSAATAERVRKAAMERGYYPDHELSRLAQLMRRGRKPGFRSTLAFLNAFPEPDRIEHEPYMHGLWQGATARAERLGYRIEQHWLGEPGLSLRRLSEILSARGIKGILVPPLPDGASLPALDWSRFVGIALTDSHAVPQLLRVAPDNALAIEIALRETTRLGYRRPGLWMPEAFDVRTQRLNSAPFLRWLHERRLNPGLMLIEEPSQRVLASWLRRLKPDVLICPHFDGYSQLWRKTVAGFATPPAFVSLTWSAPNKQFAGIDKRTEEIGAFGVDLLINALTQGRVGFQEEPPTLRVPGSWREGPSCPRARQRGAALHRFLEEMA